MDRTDGIGRCSITVHLRQTTQVSGGGVLFEACRVGSVNEADGCMILNWNMGELTRLRPSDSTELVTRQLSEMLYADRPGEGEDGMVSIQDVERHSAVTADDGTCRFTGLTEGAWLIHAADSHTYGRIEDTLTAVPCYVQDGSEWKGPVYDPDIWPKGDIAVHVKEIPETDEPQTGEPQTDEPETDEPQTEEPQTDTPRTDAPRTDTPQTNAPRKTTKTEKTPFTEKAPGLTQETKLPEPENTQIIRETPKIPEPEPEPKKKIRTPDTITTAPVTQTVRTLDDTPLSGLICAFLSAALFICVVVSGWRKKRRKRHLWCVMLAAGAGFLAASLCGIRAGAQEEGADAEAFAQMLEAEKRLVFVNESPDAPCLTVSKEVLDAEDASPAPKEDRFCFRLMINGERSGGVVYRLFNSLGEELALMPQGNVDVMPPDGAAGSQTFFRTGRDGTFFLQGGQYALFEDVSAGDVYEVWETDLEHYERVLPRSSAVISGTIERNGNHAAFVNRYVPEENVDFSEGTLEITKQILWPEDCALPVRGTFRIRVRVDDAALKNARVVLYDLENTAAAPEYTSTDADGVFEIHGRQKAVIHSLPYGADLYVEEIDDPDDLFVPCQDASWKGPVLEREKITITNRLGDAVVKKALRSGDPDDSFEFCLMGSDRQPIGGVAYYTVDGSGQTLSDEPSYTDPQGHFVLKGGQRAVLCGMAPGSIFCVQESQMAGYRQVIPDSREGYTGQRVEDALPTLLFENERTGVRPFLPSAGGAGITLILCAAVAGLGLCVTAFRKITG